MIWKVGDEFIGNKESGFRPITKGCGTHVWDGKKIVPKRKKKGEKKDA